MKTTLRLVLVVCLAYLWTAVRAAELPVGLESLDAHVARVQATFNVPGIAVAIVRDGAVLLERGYGLREIGRPEPVDAHTAFAIASNTKAFTAAALAMLMDEGKLTWDDRVIDHLPWFQMSDPYVTREMTVRDLLVHRSGLALGGGDLLFWPITTYTTEEIVRRLRYVPLATSFRSAYAYDNVLYAAATLTIERASGLSWAEFMRQRIFGPIGMRDTRASAGERREGENWATGHALFDFKDLKPVPWMSWDNNPGAGAIHSSVHDMARWMLVQLGAGRLPPGSADPGAPLFSEARQKEMWSVVTPMRPGDPKLAGLKPLKANFAGYGHGWNLTDYRGRKVVSHTGGWPGQVSRVTLIPELGVGVVVLTNQEVGAAFQAVTYHIVDALVGAPAHDWVAAYAAAVQSGRDEAEADWAKHVAARAEDSKPGRPLAAYAGTYRDAWYGDVTLGLDAGVLVMRFGRTAGLVGTLEHWQHDTFIVRWADRGLNADAFVSFSLSPDGEIQRATMEAISPLTDFSFDFHHLDLKRVEAAK